MSVMAGSESGKHDSDSGRLFDELAEAGIPTIELKAIERDFGIMREWHTLRELLAVLCREKPHTLHLNSSKIGFLGALAGRLTGVKHIIFTAHGWPHREQRPLWWKMLAWLGSWGTIVLASTIIVVSENDQRESPTLLFRDKLKLIHNGISAFPLLSREEARNDLIARAPDLSKFSRWLFMNGELHPNKGVATAIRALSELASRHKDLALVVCGEGGERAYLTDLALSLKISSRVFLVGFVPNSREYLSAADIFLMPSRKEGLPFAVLEAGLASLPVVATKVGGIPDIITDRKNGLFMPRSNTHILAKAIAFLIDNPEDAKELGKNLHTTVTTKFTEGEMVTKTLALY